MCEDMGCKLVITAANHHGENGVEERADCSLRESYDRTHATDMRLPVADILSEAAKAKRITIGN